MYNLLQYMALIYIHKLQPLINTSDCSTLFYIYFCIKKVAKEGNDSKK